jgi:hypothetical protein
MSWITWILDHWSEIAGVLGTLWVIANLVWPNSPVMKKLNTWKAEYEAAMKNNLIADATAVAAGVVRRTYLECITPMKKDRPEEGWTVEQTKQIRDFAWNTFKAEAKLYFDKNGKDLLALGEDFLKALIEQQVSKAKVEGTAVSTSSATVVSKTSTIV